MRFVYGSCATFREDVEMDEGGDEDGEDGGTSSKEDRLLYFSCQEE